MLDDTGTVGPRAVLREGYKKRRCSLRKEPVYISNHPLPLVAFTSYPLGGSGDADEDPIVLIEAIS